MNKGENSKPSDYFDSYQRILVCSPTGPKFVLQLNESTKTVITNSEIDDFYHSMGKNHEKIIQNVILQLKYVKKWKRPPTKKLIFSHCKCKKKKRTYKM